ncbi:hypothetical protein [Gloeobacter violaceus]|uniref:Glr2966 protein n=1 Tax=Gloeobacter violaceus (strain ATCC 29082 / PCC 7421) TaxID=251221 RepID=Q7NCL2_GLOVI|nr:hypothetical protein [Gloeobacter violaceus]BAC90907.1 glr2966 [Gloeobacter violaceus PCC 7421]
MQTDGKQDAVPMLPELDSTVNKVPTVAATQWTPHNGVLLSDVGVSIKVPKLPAGERSIDSIPDIWARPLLFEKALFDKKHPLHERVRDEWRGLLALCALWEVRSLPFEAKLLEIPVTQPERASAFLRAAARLCPHRVLSEDTPWNKLYVLYYNNRPVGMTSPTTLVCTAADSRGRFDGRVNWADEGGLTNPAAFLTGQERSALAHWLQNLMSALNGHPGIDSVQAGDRFNRLTGLLVEYIGDLGPAVAHDASNRPLGLDIGIYSYLNSPIKAREVKLEDSAARLVPSDGFEPAVQLLVVDPSIADCWRVRPAQVPLFGRETLASLDFAALQQVRKEDKEKVRRLGQETLRDAEWRTAAMLFSKRLLLISSTEPFEAIREVEGQRNLTYDGRSVVPILPIAGELLDYLSAEDLQRRISFLPEKNGAITIELRLPLAGVDGRLRDLLLRYTYTSDTIERRSNVPLLEVWPNFRAELWQLYYTYCDSALRSPQDLFMAQPYSRTENTPKIPTQIIQRSESDRREITRLTSPPTAFICRAYLPDVRDEQEVGVLLLKELEFRECNEAVWSIGIDFGTSSTHVYVQPTSGAEPQPLEWSAQLLHVTPSLKDDRDRLTTFFLRDIQPEIPFPTLFRPESGATGTWPFQQGNIRYFNEGIVTLNLNKNGIASGFKWSEDQSLISGFLKQLAAQCAAMAVEKGAAAIRWHISYPTAFSGFSQASLRNTWEEITEMLSIPSLSLRYQTESEAAARYFQYKEGVSLARTVCIDIGGGTSDISVWSNTALLQQSSVKFAGENIFLDLLKVNPEVLSAFGASWVTGLAEALKGSFYAEAGSLIRSDGIQLTKRLPNLLAAAKPSDSLYQFIHLITLGLAGLVFYAGLMLKRLRQEEKWGANELPYVCIGGNGARAFHWLSLGRVFDRSARQNELFSNALKAASGIGSSSKLDLRISGSPKAEVAYGLLKSERALKKEEEAIVELAGEDFLNEAGEIISWSTHLEPEMLVKGVRAPADFAHLRKFVEVYNAYAATKESLACRIDYAKAAPLIRDLVQDELNEYKLQDPSSVVIKPLFISALKALLKVEVGNWLRGR